MTSHTSISQPRDLIGPPVRGDASSRSGSSDGTEVETIPSDADTVGDNQVQALEQPIDVFVAGARVVSKGELRRTKNVHPPILIENVDVDDVSEAPLSGGVVPYLFCNSAVLDMFMFE